MLKRALTLYNIVISDNILLICKIDPFGKTANRPEVNYETKPVKKVRTSPETYLNKNSPLENKQIINEVITPLQNQNTLQSLFKSAEPERKVFENPSFGFSKPPEPINKPKQPIHSFSIPSQGALAGNGIASGEFVSNKLKFLPHVQSKESKFGNNVVPVLPSFLTEGL